MFQKPERRRTLALYTLARLAQCRYNSLKAAGRWHFWGSTWPHGDALLFALSSAQVRTGVRNLVALRCCFNSFMGLRMFERSPRVMSRKQW